MANIKQTSALLATAAILSLAPIGRAEAAVLTPGSPACNISDVSGAFQCFGSFEGNDVPNNESEILALLSGAVPDAIWSTVGKSDDAPSNGPFTSNPGGTAGTLTFDNLQKGIFAISLKAANSFSVYLINGGDTGLASVDFVTNGTALNNQGRPQSLSHASLFTAETQPIPTPALLPGLVGLGIAALRRRGADDQGTGT